MEDLTRDTNLESTAYKTSPNKCYYKKISEASRNPVIPKNKKYKAKGKPYALLTLKILRAFPTFSFE